MQPPQTNLDSGVSDDLRSVINRRLGWIMSTPREIIAVVSRDYGSVAGFGVGFVSIAASLMSLGRDRFARLAVLISRRMHQYDGMLIRSSTRFVSVNRVITLVNRQAARFLLPAETNNHRDLSDELNYTTAVTD